MATQILFCVPCRHWLQSFMIQRYRLSQQKTIFFSYSHFYTRRAVVGRLIQVGSGRKIFSQDACRHIGLAFRHVQDSLLRGLGIEVVLTLQNTCSLQLSSRCFGRVSKTYTKTIHHGQNSTTTPFSDQQFSIQGRPLYSVKGITQLISVVAITQSKFYLCLLSEKFHKNSKLAFLVLADDG